ncbi:MAG: restriction endonuclease [Ardenticatenaceae bacterium]|nr:restriction endonuclease [Ardenticatenaceae bacterium]
MTENKKNILYYGDNLQILREYVADQSIDLIYLDPPFNSKRTYNVLFKDESGKDSEAQITAFDDTWHWDAVAEATYYELITEAPDTVSRMIGALRDFIGTNQMMAYLVMMAVRLVELYRVLKPTGSLYLHCDPTASHYLKIVLDTIFGGENFVNEIVWKRTNVHNDSKSWSKVSDVIFFYAKSKEFTWNPVYAPHSESHLASKYRNREKDGRLYTLSDMTSPNPRPNMMYDWKGHTSPPNGWRYSKETMARLDEEGRIWYPDNKSKRPRLKRYLDEMPGTLLGNVWTDINPINSQAAERLGYPTQKPLALLERIVQASSNEGDIVLDPFCGCGTTVAAAEKLNRCWIGIDITHLSIALQKYRLQESFPEAEFEVIGEPKSTDAARFLAEQDRFQFEWWALSLVKARPGQTTGPSKTGKKGADKGIDGVINFIDSAKGQPKRALVQVKSGKVNSATIRDLRGVIAREQAAIGVLITLESSTQPMRTEAVSAGYYESEAWGKKYPKIQILTIEELLDGAVIEMPPAWGTFKQAEKIDKETPTQTPLF